MIMRQTRGEQRTTMAADLARRHWLVISATETRRLSVAATDLLDQGSRMGGLLLLPVGITSKAGQIGRRR